MKIYIIVFFILNILILQGCNNGGDYMDSSNVRKIREKSDLVFLEYSKFIDSNKKKLVRICDWLNSKEGYFHMYIRNGEINDLKTMKGKEYENHDNITILSNILVENNFSGVHQGSSAGSDITFFRHKINSKKEPKYISHELIYVKDGKDVNSSWEKIEGNFYYMCAVGE